MVKKIQINKNRSGETDGGSIYDDPIELPDDFGMIPTSGIIKREDGSLEVSNIRIHRVGLEFVGDISEQEYEVFGQTLLQIDTAYQWIVGDYLAYGVDNNYGMAKEFGEMLGKSEKTITNWVYVSRHVEFSRRRENLSHAHHETVSGLSPEAQDEWLARAERGNGKDGKEHKVWSVKKMRSEIARAQGESLPETTTEPAHKRWAEQSDIRAAKVLSYYRKEKDGRKRNAWKRYAQGEAERWQRIMEAMENE